MIFLRIETDKIMNLKINHDLIWFGRFSMRTLDASEFSKISWIKH